MGQWETITGRVRPRVKRGSSVIVFTRCNQNMKMIFSYPDLRMKGVTQNTKYYTTSPSFQMTLGDWTISVLDPVDDTMLLHSNSIVWEDGGDETGWRVAYVYRWMEEARDYYAQTGIIRKTKQMMGMKEMNAGVALDGKVDGEVNGEGFTE